MTPHFLRLGALIALLALLFAAPSRAFEVQEVTSPGGIKAWLVESHKVPIISMNFSFEGGANLDPEGKRGTANLMAKLLTEGGGPLDAEAFKARADELACRIWFDASDDYVSGGFTTLTKNSLPSLELLKAATTTPRFDDQPFQRAKRETLESIQQGALDQTSIAYYAWYRKAFPSHPYGVPSNGSAKTLDSINPADLKAMHTRLFSRKVLRVAVVGDITPAALGPMLDDVFGSLTETAPGEATSKVELAQGPIKELIDYDAPQTVVYFGNPSVNDQTERGFASMLLSEMLGGGASFARLTQELREKRGLTYSISIDETRTVYAGYQLGSIATANATAKQAITVLQEQLSAMARNGPTAEELRKVKAYVNGSFPLGFTTNSSISMTMLRAQERGYGTDFVQARADKVNAVKLETIREVAADLLKPERQIMIVVGRPQ